jgi:hypothetical protein
MTASNRRARSDTGQVIVLFALGLVVFLGVLAVILDGGRVYSERRRSQNAADSAATAGAAALDTNNIAGTYQAAELAACKAAAANGFGSGSVDATCGPAGSIVQVHVPTSGDGGNKLGGVLPQFESAGYVQAGVVSSFKPFVAQVMGFANFSASAIAVAANIQGSGSAYTLLVLNRVDCQAFQINGGTILNVLDGSVQVDSAAAKTAGSTCSSQNAATLVKNSTLNTPNGSNNVVGSGDALTAIPPWNQGADIVEDPLRYVHVPPFPDGNHPEISGQPGSAGDPQLWKSNVKPFPNPMPPGVVWGGISVQTGDKLVLQGGTYIMAGGGFNITQGSVTANGPVTFILTQDPTCNSGHTSGCAPGSKASNGDLPGGVSGVGENSGSWGDPTTGVLRPPTNNTVDPYLNRILIYIDRDIPPCLPGLNGNPTVGNTTLNIGGTGNFNFDVGSIIYAPCSSVKLFGNDTNTGGAVVSLNISVDGGKTLDLGGPGIPQAVPPRTNLVQ